MYKKIILLLHLFIFLFSFSVRAQEIDSRLLRTEDFGDRSVFKMIATGRKYTGVVIDSTTFQNFIYKENVKNGFLDGCYTVFWNEKLISIHFYKKGVEQKRMTFSNGNISGVVIFGKYRTILRSYRNTGLLIYFEIISAKGSVILKDIRTRKEKFRFSFS